MLLPSSFFCGFSGTLGFFLTTTPLRDFLVSFLVAGGFGFGGSPFGLGVLGSEVGIGGGGGGPVRAATALWAGRGSEQIEFCVVRTNALPEACEFHAVLFFPFSLFLKLAFADRIEEHDFIFLQSTELISYAGDLRQAVDTKRGWRLGVINRNTADLVCYAPPTVLAWLPGDVNVCHSGERGIGAHSVGGQFLRVLDELEPLEQVRNARYTHLSQTSSVKSIILLL